MVLTGSGGKNIRCGTGTAVILDNLSMDNGHRLWFRGSGNTMTLVGTNRLRETVRVEDSAMLEITGDGSLDVKGTLGSAGIGGNADGSGTDYAPGDTLILSADTRCTPSGNPFIH